MSDDADRLAEILNAANATGVSVRQVSVVAVDYANQLASVQFEGESTTRDRVRWLSPYVPAAGDISWVLFNGGDPILLGNQKNPLKPQPQYGESGTASFTISSVSVRDVTGITFAKAYGSAPRVVATLHTANVSPSVDWIMKITSVSTTDFAIRLRERTNTAQSDICNVYWMTAT